MIGKQRVRQQKKKLDRKCKVLGTLRFTAATSTKTSLRNVILHNPKSFAVTSLRSLRTMWTNYPKIEFIRAVSE